MRPEEIIPDDEINKVHGCANFGHALNRVIVADALLKCACGYHNGSTARAILVDHGLIKVRRKAGRTALTTKGRRYLYASFSKGFA